MTLLKAGFSFKNNKSVYSNNCNFVYQNFFMNPAERYILNQAEPFKTILLHLQVLVETTLPEVALLFKWKVPFYYVDKSPICYLNVTKGYVDVGFWGAQYFTKHLGKLESDKRKYVKSLRYRSLEEIEEEVLIEILEQAYTFRNEKFISDKS